MSSSKFELICHPYGCIEEIDGMRLQDIVIAVYNYAYKVLLLLSNTKGWNTYLRVEDKLDYL